MCLKLPVGHKPLPFLSPQARSCGDRYPTAGMACMGVRAENMGMGARGMFTGL